MNKKRTLVTIIGIILSTALMVGIGLLVSSVLTTERLDAKKNWGAYHAKFTNLNEKEISTISKNINIDKYYYYTPLGFAKITSSNPAKPYIYAVEANDKLLDTLNLLTGRLPKNNNELVISEHLVSSGKLKLKVGDTITLDIGVRYDEESGFLDIAHNYALPGSWNENILTYKEEEIKNTTSKTYTIVGIVEKTYYENYSDAGYMAFSLNTSPKSVYNAFVEFKNPRKTYLYLEDIANSNNLKNGLDYSANTNLLYYYGSTKYSNVNATFMPLVIIALSVISIGCIIVIYNSFAISTMERKKSFGLYSSIGATHKQIRSSVFFEAFIVGVIGIVIGTIGAFLGIYIVLQIVNNLLKDTFNPFIFSVDALYLVIPLIFMILVIFISAYLPAKRSSKVSPIEAIRGNDDIKITKREVKTPKYISKLFGIEGEIAHKNIKRNKKKYCITIISLFISIVMFNTFTSYLKYVVKATNTFDYYDYDANLDLNGTIEEIKNDITFMKSKYEIKDSLTIVDRFSLTPLNLTKNDFSDKYLQFFNKEYDSDIEEITRKRGFMALVLTDEDYHKITSAEGVILNHKYLTTYEGDTRKTTDLTLLKNNNKTLEFNYETKNINLTLNATVIDNIWGLKHTNYEEMPIILISESTYQEKIGYDNSLDATFIMNTNVYQEINKDIENKKITLYSSSYFSSPKIDMANTKNLVITIKILFYGFITLVTLIGVTSVINTINTNINLRRKEFAMLRSIGLSPRGFNKLLFFESLFFGLKSLIYGIPVSLAINFLISLSIGNMLDTGFIINWGSLLISVIAVFAVVLLSMNYASKKIKKENILEALREENI